MAFFSPKILLNTFSFVLSCFWCFYCVPWKNLVQFWSWRRLVSTEWYLWLWMKGYKNRYSQHQNPIIWQSSVHGIRNLSLCNQTHFKDVTGLVLSKVSSKRSSARFFDTLGFGISLPNKMPSKITFWYERFIWCKIVARSIFVPQLAGFWTFGPLGLSPFQWFN